MPRLSFVALTVVLLSAVSICADMDPSYSPYAVLDTVPFYPGGTYDAAVPKPNDHLKHAISVWPLRIHELDAYLEALTGITPRVKVEVHGQSYEGRNLYNVFISTPENLQRLEDIRTTLDRLASGETVANADELIRDLPAIAWLGYSIHGDEISGVDAAVQLIYQLAAGTDPATLDIIENVVVIVDPSQNPDGRERYLSMLQSYKSEVPNYDRDAMQHNGVWPWGRGNHYLFDMNRDWVLLRQKETVSKVATLLKWHPQLCVDGHEMGSNATFLFSPPTDPINYNTPEHYLKWGQVFANDQAAAFDKNGWAYYTGEWHEQWYPGYGSAWTAYSGGIGILYEMAGVDGSMVKQRDDYVLTYHEAINKQFTSSLANLTTLAANREQILREYHQVRKQITEQGRASKLQFLFKPGRDEIKAKRFVESLTGQGIEVDRAKADFTVSRVTDRNGAQITSERFPAGTFIVSTAQPYGALAKAILEFDPRLNLDFLKKERKELEKNGGTKMYEVSTWTPALAYDLDAFYTTAPVSVDTEPVITVALSSGRLHNPDAQFAFIIDMVGEKTYLMLTRLFQEDVIIYAAEKPFTIEGRDYAGGSLVLRVRGNNPNLSTILGRLVAEVSLDVYGVGTGNSSQGSLLGAETYRLLSKPKIGIVMGEGIDYGEFGSLWFVLDQELKIPHSLLNLSNLPETGLERFNVLVLPSSWGQMGPKLGEGGKAALAGWVESGGTLIATREAAAWLADSATGLSSVRLRRDVLGKLDEYELGVQREQQAEAPEVDTMALWYPEKVPAEKAAEKPGRPGLEELKALDDWQRRFAPGGVILRADIDTEDWLAFGLNKTVPVSYWGDFAFMSKPPVRTVARFSRANDLRLSGLLWPEARARWVSTAFATREAVGNGQVILFANGPDMRAYFYGTRQLFVNALLYGPGFGTRFEGPYGE